MQVTLDPRTFRRTCSKFATGITITTVVGVDGAPHGLTVNSFTSVSAIPPMVLVCIDHSSNVLPHFRAARHYGVSVLSDQQQDISQRFAQRGMDRFQGLDYETGSTGVPLIPGALAHFECEVRDVVEAGDHTIFVAEVTGADTREGRPLLYFDSGYQRLG